MTEYNGWTLISSIEDLNKFYKEQEIDQNRLSGDNPPKDYPFLIKNYDVFGAYGHVDTYIIHIATLEDAAFLITSLEAC